MKWIPASEGKPDTWHLKCVRFIHTKAPICAPEIFLPQQEELSQVEWLDEHTTDDMPTAFQNEPVNFLLSNALLHLTQDQQIQLCNALQERLPPPANVQQEATDYAKQDFGPNIGAIAHNQERIQFSPKKI